ncbi:hypothetical protein ACQP1W_19475 [Spirillospora sp. CA-255316]
MTALVGTGGMVRLILRRDRFLLPIWILFLGLMPLNFAAASKELYATVAEQLSYARTTGNNPTFLALYGPLHDTGIGGIVAQRSGFIPVIIGLICALTVIRHTRTEEEAGRRELLGSTVVGRGAALAAALLVTLVASVLVGLILTVGMTAQDLGFGGALALGLQFALAGWVFAGVAGVAAQLAEGAGSARGIAVTVLGASFVVRLAADVGGPGNGLSWLSWLSPLGWGTRLRAFGDEQWPVALLPLALTAALVVAAGALSAGRDVGAGLLPPKPGPRARRRGCAARSRWPGGCTAGRCSPGSPGSPPSGRCSAASRAESRRCWWRIPTSRRSSSGSAAPAGSWTCSSPAS